jgi:uncharacterized protein (DUF1697 family)
MRFVALLRGINVGGNNRIAMADLRALHGAIGHTDVLTHLQSGNVVFTAKAAKHPDTDVLAHSIEKAITGELGLTVRVVVRSGAEMRAVVDHDPLADVATDPARHLVTFLSAAPAADKLATIDPADYAPERFAVQGREVYMWLPDGIRDAKLGRIAWDRKFGVVATGRNWNTVTKLADMARE